METHTYIGEVCRDFMNGSCPDGEDCKFAHPDICESAILDASRRQSTDVYPDDDIPYVPSSDLITSPPPVMYFPICDILSPVSIASPISPLCLMSPMSLSSFHVPALVPSTPPVVQLPPRKKSSKPKKKLIITPPEAIELSFHRVVDGTTLLDRELPQVRIEKEPDEEYTTSTETPSLGGLFCARSIARPMSTPPVVHHDKVVKVSFDLIVFVSIAYGSLTQLFAAEA